MSKKPPSHLQYLSQSDRLEESGSPGLIRNTVLVIGIVILSFTAWSAFTDINEVARSPGEIIPGGHNRVVQHLEGGIVQGIHTHEGQKVSRGDLLLEIGGEGAREDLERAKSRQITLSLQEERLRAFLENRPADFSRYEDTHPKLVQDQAGFSRDMSLAHEQEKQVIRDQIAQKERVIRTLETELSTARANHQIAQKLFERRRKLHARGHISDTRFLEQQQNLNEIRGRISQTQSRIAVAKAEVDEFKNRLQSAGSGYGHTVNERLDAVLSEKGQNEELIQKLTDRVNRLAVRAPAGGIVKGIAVKNLGAVVRPGETLMEIIPMDEEMLVEVKIPPHHIAHIAPGQKVKVKISSYDFSRHGMVDGKLSQISASTFSGEGGERYYRGIIKLENTYVGHNSANIITPGMTAMAEIITGEKTILQYLLKPIHNALTTSFGER